MKKHGRQFEYITGQRPRFVLQASMMFFGILLGLSLTAEASTPPTGLSAGSETTSSVVLTWTDNAGDETGFRLERCDASISACDPVVNDADYTVGWDLPADADPEPSTTSYTDTSVCPGDNVSYRVRVEPDVTTTWIGPATKLIPSPGAPSISSIIQFSESEVDVNWNDNTTDESGFTIERCDGTSSWTCGATPNKTDTVGPGVTTYHDSGLTRNLYYTYRIRADKASASCPSDWPIYSTAGWVYVGPMTPWDFTGIATTSSVALSWTDTATNETGFRLERCNGSSSACHPHNDANYTVGWDLPANAGTGPASYEDTTLCPGDNVGYRMRAENPAWETPYTVWVGAGHRTIAAPSAPTGFTAVMVSELQAALSWTRNTTDESGFTIERCDDTNTWTCGTSPNETYTVGLGITAFQDNNLQLYKDYTYRVRADKDSASCPEWPTGYSGTDTVYSDLLVPADLAAATVDTTTIDLTWTDNAGSETDFIIGRCNSDTWTCGATPHKTFSAGDDTESFTDDTVCNSQQDYTYKIKSISEGLSKSGGGCWSKKVLMTFGSGGADFEPFYPVHFKITLASFPGMQADFRDVRFYDATLQQELKDYWFREKTVGASATVWLRTGGYNDIYMYYGNSDAVDSSVTDAAFTEVYDDFQGTVIDVSKWVELDRPGDMITQNDDLIFNITATNERDWNKGIISTETFERAAGNEVYFDVTVNHPYRSYGSSAFGWGKDQVTDPNPRNSNIGMHLLDFYGPSMWKRPRFRQFENGLWADIPGVYNMFEHYLGYELKIVLKEAGAMYYVRGTYLYPGPDWTLIHETSTNFSPNDDVLRIGMYFHSQPMTIHSVSVKHAAAFRVSGFNIPMDETVCAGDLTSWETSYSSAVAGSTSNNTSAPSDLTVTILNDTEIKLDWTDNTDNETGFMIERCNDTAWTCGSTPHEDFTVGTGITTYTDTTLSASTSVTYRVKVYKTTSDCSWESGYDTATYVRSSAGTPAGLSATALNSFMIRLDWTDTGADEDGFEIEMQSWNGNFGQIATVGAGVETYTETCGIEPDTNYTFRVRSYRGSDTSSWATTSVTTPAWTPGDSTSTCTE